jgi:alanine transaminase
MFMSTSRAATASIRRMSAPFSSTIAPNKSSAAPTPKAAALLTKAQVAQWNSYLATGRGSVALFASIDRDEDNSLTRQDISTFFDAIEESNGEQLPSNPKKVLDKRAADKPVTLQEFQEWLVQTTVEAGYHGIQPDDTHARQSQHKPLLATTLQEVKVDHDQDIYAWNSSTMSQNLKRMQYAVRGEVVIKADKLAASGRKITYTNVGNPHAVGQPPITFYRQVLALCDLPAENGVDHPNAGQLFPVDVLERAREMRAIVGPSGTGAYTNSQGLAGVRKHVAEYITNRDGHMSNEGDIFLTNGASCGIELVLSGLISQDNDAIMIPIPQYPIYSALIARLGGCQLGYEMDESLGWAVTEEELERRVVEAAEKNWNIKGMALINPGNPTGQVLQRKDIELICKFCARHGIVLLADEVYQRNVYSPDREFISTKKVAVETPECENLELASFHSTSKGLIGECGRRGGYMELHGIDPYVQSQIYKLASSGLCSGVAGQVMTSLMVKGPEEGGASYDQFMAEEATIFESLKRRAKMMVDGLNAIDGIECNSAEGAMYAFPSLTLPPKALEEADANDQTPDTLYALSLLEETGICVVPASGFGQRKGRVGFRTTFLPPEDELKVAIGEMARHHKFFCEKYA